MKSKSSIFNDRELEAINKRINGDYTDPTGVFSKIRPKLREIEIWSKNKAKLKKLLRQKRRTEFIDEKPKTEEKSFEEFRQEIGY